MGAREAEASASTPSRPSRFAGLSAGRILPPLLGLAILLGVWSYGGAQGWGGGMVIPISEAVEPIIDDTNRYWRATRATTAAALRGGAIGSALAFAAALIAASVPALRRSIIRLAAIANAAPWVAVAPALLIILGRESGPVAVAALAVFFFVFISTAVGLGAASEAVHDVASVLGASRLRRVWSVQLPAAWPSIADGLKLAAPAALAGAIFGEWYGAQRGLGVQLITAMQAARPSTLWAASLLASALGLSAFALLAGARILLARRYGGTIAEGVSPEPPRRSFRRAFAIEVGAIVSLAVVLTFAWWAWIEINDISPIVVPRPSAVWSDLISAPGEYWSATLGTLLNAGVAMAIGTTVGVLFALAASRYRLLSGMTVPIAVVLSATPLVALFPLFARIFGYQPNTVRILAAVLVFYPMFVYTRSGLAAASEPLLDVVDSLGGAKGRRFRLVVLPAAVPHIASGLRIAAGSAVIAAVVGEFLIGRVGLGVEFSYAYRLLRLPRAFGAALVIVAVSLVVFAAGAGSRGWSTPAGDEPTYREGGAMATGYSRREFLKLSGGCRC